MHAYFILYIFKNCLICSLCMIYDMHDMAVRELMFSLHMAFPYFVAEIIHLCI